MENLQQAQTADYQQISNEKEQELDYWSREFGISKDELTEAVKAGGSSTGAIEKYVKRVQLTA